MTKQELLGELETLEAHADWYGEIDKGQLLALLHAVIHKLPEETPRGLGPR
jgi:hypothetical protein